MNLVVVDEFDFVGDADRARAVVCVSLCWVIGGSGFDGDCDCCGSAVRPTTGQRHRFIVKTAATSGGSP